MPRQFRPNHCRHSRMISYHCFSVETENQKRCSSWVVILSGSSDFDIVESLEISVSIQLPLPALHRAVPPLAYSQGQRHPIVRVLLILICVVSTAHRPGGATSYGGLIRNLRATGDYSGVSPILASYHTHSLLVYFSTKKPPGGGFWLDESTILKEFLDSPFDVIQPFTWRYFHFFPFR